MCALGVVLLPGSWCISIRSDGHGGLRHYRTNLTDAVPVQSEQSHGCVVPSPHPLGCRLADGPATSAHGLA